MKRKVKNSGRCYGGFYDLVYKGKQIKFDEEVKTEVMYFQHTYLTAGFNPDARKTHACLRMGYWCWQNAWEHPKDIITYLKRKLTPHSYRGKV
jgi:hypothetical protein